MNKFVYIPGFLDTGKNRKMEPALEIWLDDIDPNERMDAEFVIGHSLGANFALVNRSHNKNTKLILTNPVLYNRSFFNWEWRWIKYIFTTDEKFSKGRWATLLHPGLMIKRYFQLMRIDFVKILRDNADNMIIIRGKKDNLLCDEETEKLIKSCSIKLIEVDNAGHDWEDLREEALKQLKNMESSHIRQYEIT